jgi:hypothetical protein
MCVCVCVCVCVCELRQETEEFKLFLLLDSLILKVIEKMSLNTRKNTSRYVRVNTEYTKGRGWEI